MLKKRDFRTIVNVSKKADEHLASTGDRALYDIIDAIENSRCLVVSEPLHSYGYISSGVCHVFIAHDTDDNDNIDLRCHGDDEVSDLIQPRK